MEYLQPCSGSALCSCPNCEHDREQRSLEAEIADYERAEARYIADGIEDMTRRRAAQARADKYLDHMEDELPVDEPDPDSTVRGALFNSDIITHQEASGLYGWGFRSQEAFEEWYYVHYGVAYFEPPPDEHLYLEERFDQRSVERAFIDKMQRMDGLLRRRSLRDFKQLPAHGKKFMRESRACWLDYTDRRKPYRNGNLPTSQRYWYNPTFP